MRSRAHRQQGFFLLEALIALLVFALATVGLLGVLVGALRESGNARWRSEAFDVASSTLARMATEDAGGLAARYDRTASGAGYQALLAAARELPGVSESVNPPSVTIEDGPGSSRLVAITVRWHIPGDRDSHRVSVRGSVPGP